MKKNEFAIGGGIVTQTDLDPETGKPISQEKVDEVLSSAGKDDVDFDDLEDDADFDDEFDDDDTDGNI